MARSFTHVLVAVSIGAALLARTTEAGQWPGSIVGTWKAIANQSPLTLTITSQGTTGACKAISGTIADVAGGQKNTIQGFYCPESGRFSFLRKTTETNDTFQVYSGNVSLSGTGSRMGGVFAEENQASLLGEYNFEAQK